MAEWTADEIAHRALELDLIDGRALQSVMGDARNTDAAGFQQHLLRRELLTAYQLERLLRGDRTGYFYGHYKVLYQVGSGTFARVHRAVHRETGKVVAVKVLRSRFSDDATKRDQFNKEAEVGQALRHPNIVAIYEVATGAEFAVHGDGIHQRRAGAARFHIHIRKHNLPRSMRCG